LQAKEQPVHLARQDCASAMPAAAAGSGTQAYAGASAFAFQARCCMLSNARCLPNYSMWSLNNQNASLRVF